ncbi:hypothetical protein FI667_g5649, partial [Globisporangium splendens]
MRAVVRADQELVFHVPSTHWVAGQCLSVQVGSKKDVEAALQLLQCHVFHEQKRTRIMASKLPPPRVSVPSALHAHKEKESAAMSTHHTTARSHPCVHHPVPTQPPLSHVYSPSSVASSASPSSSPEVAVTPVMDVPPRLELHDLSGGVECISANTGLAWTKRAVVTTERREDTMECADVLPPSHVPGDAAQNESTMDDSNDVRQSPATVSSTTRTGIPSINMANPHARVRSNSYKHSNDDSEANQTPSRIARYGSWTQPKKKPMVIDTNWSDDIADESCSTTPECHTGDTNPISYSPKEAAIASQHALASPIATGAAPSPLMAACPSTTMLPQAYHAEAQSHIPETIASVEQTEVPSVQPSPPKFQGKKVNVQPPKTPSGGSSYEAFADDGESRLSASQRVRMGLSAYMANGHSVMNGMTEPMWRQSHDDSASPNLNHPTAPPSYPPLFHASGKQHFSMRKAQRSQRGGADLIVSKLLPSRQSLNSLMGYVRELQQSEASLREQLQLERSKHRTEKDAIEKQMMEQQIEMEREQSQRKREAQEQIIRDLHAKIAQLQEEKHHEVGYDRGLQSIHEEEVAVSDQYQGYGNAETATSDVYPTASGCAPVSVPSNGYGLDQSVPQQTVDAVQSPMQAEPNARNQHQLIISPRGTKPLWDSWSSDSPLTPANAPMFTIAPTSADMLSESPQLLGFVAPAAVSSETNGCVLKSVLSPKNSVFREQKSESSRGIFQSNEVVATASEIDAPPAFTIGGIAMPAHISPTTYAPAHEGHDSEPEMCAVVEEPQCPSPDFVPETASVFAPSCTPGEASLVDEPPQAQDTMVIDASEANPEAPHSKLFQPFRPHPVAKSPLVHGNEPANPRVSLEKLLKDFFEEVDKAKLRMAEVYAKRYISHEERLFAELSRRYGVDKVERLKCRYEDNVGAEQQHVQSISEAVESAPQNMPATCLRSPTSQDAPPLQYPKIGSNGADALPPPPVSSTNGKRSPGLGSGYVVSSNKVSSKGRSQSMNGFHPPMPPVFYDLHADHTDAHSDHPTEDSDVSSPTNAYPFPVVTPSATYDDDQVPTATDAGDDEEENVSTIGGFTSQAPPRQQTSTSRADGATAGRLRADIPPPPMTDFTHAKGGSKASPIMRQGELSRGPPPPPLANAYSLRDEKSSNVASLTGQKTMQTEQRPSSPQTVTLESLLRDLYKKHQPDKLQSVSRVAREYAGRERALVQLLKTKYGALSVKHLEENLALLEKAASKPSPAMTERGRKKRGLAGRSIRFLTRCALLSASAMALAGAGLVYINSRECASRAAATADAAESCDEFNHDLSGFEYGNIGQHLAHAYPVDCVCSEWREREDALMSSSYSWDSVVSLAQLLPFSQSTVEAYFENTPASEYYHQYGKPVVDIVKAQEPVIRASLNQFGDGVSSVMTDVYRHIYSPKVLGNDPEPSEHSPNVSDDGSLGNESAEDALTKMAQASKSLLALKQAVDTSVEVRSNNDFGFTESVTHGEKRDTSASDIQEHSTSSGLAVVELEVQQEDLALSFLSTEVELQPVCSLLSNEGSASVHELNDRRMTEEEKMRDAVISELIQANDALSENAEESLDALVVAAHAIESEDAAMAIGAELVIQVELEIVNSGESDDSSSEDVSEGELSVAMAEQPADVIAEQPYVTEEVVASLSQEESISVEPLDESSSQTHAVDTSEEIAEIVDSADAIITSDFSWMEDEQAAAGGQHAPDATNSVVLETDFVAAGEILTDVATESSSEAAIVSVAFSGEAPLDLTDELLILDKELDTTEAEAAVVGQTTLDEAPSSAGTGDEPSETAAKTDAHQATAEDHAMDTTTTLDVETQAMEEVDEALRTTYTENALGNSEQHLEPFESSNQVQHDDHEHTTAPQSLEAILPQSNADEAAEDVDFDFGDDLFAFDASELLEMAERAAAAQLA